MPISRYSAYCLGNGHDLDAIALAQWVEVFLCKGEKQYNLAHWYCCWKGTVCYVLDGRSKQARDRTLTALARHDDPDGNGFFHVAITDDGNGIESSPVLKYITPEALKRAAEMVKSFKVPPGSDFRIPIERTFRALSQRGVTSARVVIMCVGGDETADVVALRDAIRRFKKSDGIKIDVYSYEETGPERRKIMTQIATENHGKFKVIIDSP